MCPFYIAFQVLKVYTSTLIKICKIQLPDLLGFFVFISFYISRYQFFSNLHRTENFIQHLKKKLSRIFLFKWIHSNSTSPTLLRPKFAKCMKTKYLTWNSIISKSEEDQHDKVYWKPWFGYISLSSPGPVKSPSNSTRRNCQKIFSWSKRSKTILEIRKKDHISLNYQQFYYFRCLPEH